MISRGTSYEVGKCFSDFFGNDDYTTEVSKNYIVDFSYETYKDSILIYDNNLDDRVLCTPNGMFFLNADGELAEGR